MRTHSPLLASWVVLIAVLGFFVPFATIPIAIYGFVIARREGAQGYALAYGAIAVLSALYLCAILYVFAA